MKKLFLFRQSLDLLPLLPFQSSTKFSRNSFPSISLNRSVSLHSILQYFSPQIIFNCLAPVGLPPFLIKTSCPGGAIKLCLTPVGFFCCRHVPVGQRIARLARWGSLICSGGITAYLISSSRPGGTAFHVYIPPQRGFSFLPLNLSSPGGTEEASSVCPGGAFFLPTFTLPHPSLP